MSVNNVNSASGTSSIGAPDAAQSLASTLMSGTVVDLDSQLTDANNEMKSVNEEKQDVRDSKTALANIDTNATTGTVYVDTSGAIVSSWNDSSVTSTGVEGVILTDSQYQKLKSIADTYGVTLPSDFTTGGGETHYMTKEAYDKIVGKDGTLPTALDDKLDSLNSTSELKMIKLQGLMDARKQAIMMLTNMIQSQSQTNQGIVQNMKG